MGGFSLSYRGTTRYTSPNLQLKAQNSYQVYFSLTLMRVMIVESLISTFQHTQTHAHTYAYCRTASLDNKPGLLLRPLVKQVSVEALQYRADNPLDILFYKLKQLDALAYFCDWLGRYQAGAGGPGESGAKCNIRPSQQPGPGPPVSGTCRQLYSAARQTSETRA